MFKFYNDIGIDLGTANILIHIKGQGIVLNEPAVVVMDEETKKPIAVGIDAKEMIGKTPGKVKVIRPLKDGVIADFDATEIMLNYFINKINARKLFSSPRILICCPSNITSVEKNAIREVAQKTGARRVFIEEEPKVAAIGAGMDISKPSASMVIDMGGGTTDIAVLSLGDIVCSKSIRIAGNSIDQEVIDYMKTNHRLLIGERTAEEIKKTCLTVYKETKSKTTAKKTSDSKLKKISKESKHATEFLARGRDIISGLPKEVKITSNELRIALSELVNEIVVSVKSVLEDTPPELSADILEKGIVLTGGGALLHGFDKLLQDELRVPVFIADQPLNCVVIGTGIMLDILD